MWISSLICTNYPQKIGSQEPRQIGSIKTLDLKSSQNRCSFSVSIVVGSNFGKVRLGTMLVKEYFAWWDPVARRCHKPNSRRRIGPHTGMNKCFTIWYKYFEVKQLKLNTYLKHNNVSTQWLHNSIRNAYSYFPHLLCCLYVSIEQEGTERLSLTHT